MVSWTKYARLARSLVLKIKHQDYVMAALLSGARTRHILWRYMLPSVLPALVITAATDIGGMMLELAGFSFLGLGAQSTSIEWGYMLNEGRAYMESAPWLMIYPGIAICITVVVFNLLGDSLRDILDPRDQNQPSQKNKRRVTNMKKMTKAAALLVVALLTFSVFTGCSDSADANGNNAAADGGTGAGSGQGGASHLNFGLYNFSDSRDPAVNVNASWTATRYSIAECLFRFNRQVVAEPNLCDSYTVSDDYTTWTLHIREGVRFSNGNPVTASAVVASVERVYAETDVSRGGTGNSTPKQYLVYESISADDDADTVTIVCENATPNMPGILAYPYFSIIDVTVADQEIIGTGPYKVINDNAGISLDLERNELYWNGEVPYDTVTLIYIEDSSTKAMALQSGDIDLTENVTTASDLDSLEANDDFYVSNAAGVRTGNSYFNYHGVMANDALRQAVIMALDYETMCNITVAGMYTPGISVLPSSLAYNYNQLTTPFPFDTQAAIDLLDEAGIVDTDGDGWRELDGVNIDLNYLTYNSRNLNDFAEATSLQLAEIGIKATVNLRDYDTAMGLKSSGEFDLLTSNAITVGVGDPEDYLATWYTPGSVSWGSYSNPGFDAIFETLMVEVDADRRVELITQLQQILIDDAATIVHGYYNSTMISNVSRVTGADIPTIDYYWLTTDIRPAG